MTRFSNWELSQAISRKLSQICKKVISSFRLILFSSIRINQNTPGEYAIVLYSRVTLPALLATCNKVTPYSNQLNHMPWAVCWVGDRSAVAWGLAQGSWGLSDGTGDCAWVPPRLGQAAWRVAWLWFPSSGSGANCRLFSIRFVAVAVAFCCHCNCSMSTVRATTTTTALRDRYRYRAAV